mgnify:CR=1 FL=1
MSRYNNHLSQGSIERNFKGRPVTSTLNSENLSQSLSMLDNQSGGIGIIPPGYEHRPDKIADLFYGSPTLDWVVLWTNDISDPFEQLKVGDRIKIVTL